MRVRTRISTVRLGSREYRVIRPARPLVHAALYAEPHGVPTEPHSLAMYVGRVEAVLLTALWGLATCSPRTLLYLPMRDTAPPLDMPHSPALQAPLDLVLLHHRMQFPLSRWKQVRSRLGDGRPHTASVPPGAFTLGDRAGRRRAGDRDHLRIGFAADTAFVTGSAAAFGQHGGALRTMLDEAGPHLKRSGGRHHYCVELGDHDAHPWSHRRRRHHTLVHIQYSPRWRAD